MRLLILGCSGFIGRELVPILLTAGHQVTLVSRKRSLSWLNKYNSGSIITLPIAHGEGRFQCDEDTLNRLEDEDCIALTYSNNLNLDAFIII